MYLESGTEKWESIAYHNSAESGGTGGDLAGKIKLVKVDADDNITPLKNAVFTVTRQDGPAFELTTGDDGRPPPRNSSGVPTRLKRRHLLQVANRTTRNARLR